MNTQPINYQYTAFGGFAKIATGILIDVATQVKTWMQEGNQSQVLIFDNTTSQTIELDFRGTLEDVQKRLSKSLSTPTNVKSKNPRSPGRPKLGVVAREVTLLPRHWEWLQLQPGGASVTIRKLVENAKKISAPEDRMRQSREACYAFMVTIAGDQAGFEEATRALFSGELDKFEQEIKTWPNDIQNHAMFLATDAFSS